MAPRLRVFAGTSIQTLQDISPSVNTRQPHRLQSNLFEGEVVVNIKGFVDPDTEQVKDPEYFSREDRQRITWSLQVQGRFLEPFSADDVLFGNVFERPLMLPWGSGAAFAFMKFIDPALEHDLTSSTKPWALSPLIATMPHFSYTSIRPPITATTDSDSADDPARDSLIPKIFPPSQSLVDDTSQLHLTLIQDERRSPGSSISSSSSTSSSSLHESQSQSSSVSSSSSRRHTFKSSKSNGKHTTADHSISPVLPKFTNAKERRSYFGTKEHRQLVRFGPQDLITVDFCYGFLEFNPALALRLPGGVTFDLTKYWDGQPVRFVCCERKLSGSGSGDDPWGRVFWCISIESTDTG